MTPDAPSPRPADHAPSCSASQERPRSWARLQWRVLLGLLVLGLCTTGGCTLSPGPDIPSITTAESGDFTTTDSTGSPIAGSGGASAAGGAPNPGLGGAAGGYPCFDGPGGEGGAAPLVTPVECGDPQ